MDHVQPSMPSSSACLSQGLCNFCKPVIEAVSINWMLTTSFQCQHHNSERKYFIMRNTSSAMPCLSPLRHRLRFVDTVARVQRRINNAQTIVPITPSTSERDSERDSVRDFVCRSERLAQPSPR